MILHFKRNHFLLIFWILLFGFTTGIFAQRYGVSYQFLFPEYMGKTGMLSFGIFGFSLGGFVVAFNLYTYILHGFRFPFIASVNQPFLKFSYNNLLLPLTYVLVYGYMSYYFQIDNQLLSKRAATVNLLGFFGGGALFVSLALLYFRYTNKQAPEDEVDGVGKGVIQSQIHKSQDWIPGMIRSKWRVDTYINSFYQIRVARSSDHYRPEIFQSIFSQNHVNASFFQIILVITYLLLGGLRGSSLFAIPAAASLVLFFTMSLMLISAIFTWTKGWTMTIFLILFIIINYFFSSLPIISISNQAYGLNYNVKPAEYTRENLSSIQWDDARYEADKQGMIEILEAWKIHNQRITGLKKPKLIIINCSGGGLRSALWTMESMLKINLSMDGSLFAQSALITGSSGGMIGASYLRELYLRQIEGKLDDFYDDVYTDNIAKDLLNPLLLTMTTNDLFVRYKTIEVGAQTYTLDRAASFERQLNINTGQVLYKRLSDYRAAEKEAIIPTVIMAPTIINDGRRLLISAQPISFLCRNVPSGVVEDFPVPEDVEFGQLFSGQDADSLLYTSALRMNATFPYIMPIVSLPSEPEIEVMDAGLRDNFGTKTTMQYLYSLREWINENTGGIVVIELRDLEVKFETEAQKDNLINRFTAPLGSFYENVTKTQDFNSEQSYAYLTGMFDQPIDVVSFQLKQRTEDRISLSWHLTEAEKRRIRLATESEDFGYSISRLKALLQP